MKYSAAYKISAAFAALAVCLTAAPAMAQRGQVMEPQSLWSVASVKNKGEGKSGFCTLSRRFDQGVVLSVAENQGGEMSLALDFQSMRLQPGEAIAVTLDPGAEGRRTYDVTPRTGNAFVVRTGTDQSVYNAMLRTGFLRVEMGRWAYHFNLADIDMGHRKLGDCLAALPDGALMAAAPLPAAPVQAVAAQPAAAPVLAPPVQGAPMQAPAMQTAASSEHNAASAEDDRLKAENDALRLQLAEIRESQARASGAAQKANEERLAALKKENDRMRETLTRLETSRQEPPRQEPSKPAPASAPVAMPEPEATPAPAAVREVESLPAAPQDQGQDQVVSGASNAKEAQVASDKVQVLDVPDVPDEPLVTKSAPEPEVHSLLSVQDEPREDEPGDFLTPSDTENDEESAFPEEDNNESGEEAPGPDAGDRPTVKEILPGAGDMPASGAAAPMEPESQAQPAPTAGSYETEAQRMEADMKARMQGAAVQTPPAAIEAISENMTTPPVDTQPMKEEALPEEVLSRPAQPAPQNQAESAPAAAPSPNRFFMPVFAVKELLAQAQIVKPAEVQAVSPAAGEEGLALYQWQMSQIFGSAEISQTAGRDFDALAQAYLERTQARCGGDFAIVPDNTRQIGTGRADTYDVACVGGGQSGSAALIFLQQGDEFIVIAHEAGPDAMAQAMEARDRLIGALQDRAGRVS